MSDKLWSNEKYRCPECGSELNVLSSTLTEDIQQKTMSCTNKNCKKIYNLHYKLVLDSFVEYKDE